MPFFIQTEGNYNDCKVKHVIRPQENLLAFISYSETPPPIPDFLTEGASVKESAKLSSDTKTSC